MGSLKFVAQLYTCATVRTLSSHYSLSLLYQLLSLTAAEDGIACHNQQPTLPIIQYRDSIIINGAVIVFIRVVY